MSNNLAPSRSIEPVSGWNGLDTPFERMGTEDEHWYCYHISHDSPSVMHSAHCPCNEIESVALSNYRRKAVCDSHGMQFIGLANGNTNADIMTARIREKKRRDAATRERLTV